MPLPTVGDVHINRPLTNVAIAFFAEQVEYVASRVFPAVPVPNKSDNYFVWNRGDMHRNEAQKVAPATAAPIGNLRLASDQYIADVYKFAHLIADEERANQDAPLNLDDTKTRDVMRKLLIAMEVSWASSFFTTGVWTGAAGIGGGADGADLVGAAVAGANQFVYFDNYATSDPIKLFRNQITHLGKLGVPKSQMKLTIGAEAWSVLADHPRLIERFENVQASIMETQHLRAVLGIGDVVVPTAIRNTAGELKAPTNEYISGSSALLTFAPPSPSIDTPSAGYTFMWAGLTGSANSGIRMKRFRRDVLDADQIQGEAAWGQKITAPELGVFFSNVISP